MSNREGRSSDSNRYRPIHSSPKRHRRDMQPEMERKSRNIDMHVSGIRYHAVGPHNRLKDTFDLEDSLVPGTNRGTEFLSKEAEKKFNAYDDFSRKINGLNEGTKNWSDSTELPRSRSSFQHDERSGYGKSGYNLGGRLNSGEERGWGRDPVKDLWLHDRYSETDTTTNPPNPVRKRPAFREKKAAAEAWGRTGATEDDGVRGEWGAGGGPGLGNGRRGDRYVHYQAERRPEWGRERERYGRPRLTELRPVVDKWKHDMFDQANRSPTPNNVDDHIATVEALLES